MKISSVQTSCLNIPVKVPVTEKPDTVGLVLALVHTDEGITGIGISRELEMTATRELINRELAPFLVGKDPMATEKIWKDAAWDIGMSYKVGGGVVARAVSAVDQALWDIKGKYLGQPIYRLLGGAVSSSVATYITFGLNVLTLEELVEAARQVVGQGHDRIKYQVVAADRGKDVSVDAARLRAVREALGDGVMLIVDGNAKFDFTHARELLRRIEPLNIGCFDHPVVLRDLRLMAELRHCTTIPLAARAYSGSQWDNRDMILAGAVDVIHSNVLDSGGYTGGWKVAHMAEMFHLPLATGGAFHSQNAHLIGGVPNGWMTEYHLLLAQATEAIFVDAPKPEAGRLALPDKPGLGLELNAAAVQEYTEA
ncbi:MAG TPA: mandelate racemase/muconate lactonizing enzyme family protein [Dehalococcoidia bacterium]|nr:mandelate racemase/muconate lactonizing enzyme family protein [Dehalococcoidia bacterium]